MRLQEDKNVETLRQLTSRARFRINTGPMSDELRLRQGGEHPKSQRKHPKSQRNMPILLHV